MILEGLAPLRAPWTPVVGSVEDLALEWMYDQDDILFLSQISNLHDDFYFIQAAAGKGHENCADLQSKLDDMDQRLKLITIGAARDYQRYHA